MKNRPQFPYSHLYLLTYTQEKKREKEEIYKEIGKVSGNRNC